MYTNLSDTYTNFQIKVHKSFRYITQNLRYRYRNLSDTGTQTLCRYTSLSHTDTQTFKMQMHKPFRYMYTNLSDTGTQTC